MLTAECRGRGHYAGQRLCELSTPVLSAYRKSARKRTNSGLLLPCREVAIDIAPLDDSPGIAGFDSEVVVHSDAQLLFAAQVHLMCCST